jgi:hypothetical protein
MVDAIKTATMGLKRMSVVICCVLSITVIDVYHAYVMEPMGAGTITAITLIAALGGVDVWKNGLLKKGLPGV